MRILLDTNVISEAMRPHPDPRVMRFLHESDEEQLFLSVITLGELRRGVALKAAGRRKASLEAWIAGDLRLRFEGRVLDVTVEVAEAWGDLLARRSKQGATMPAVDALLAATALVQGLALATRNTSDFASCGVPVFDPWSGETHFPG